MGRLYTKSVRVSEETHLHLEELKLLPEEPYGAVVAKLVEFYQNNKRNVLNEKE